MAKSPPSDNVKYAVRVAKGICRQVDKRTLALTAVTTAIEDRIGEDIVLIPRNEPSVEAVVYTVGHEWQGRMLRRHCVVYHMPDWDPQAPPSEELLDAVLDIAHELGHLILEEGPGRCHPGLGITKPDQWRVGEIEADWFALCILQMYGFVFPRH